MADHRLTIRGGPSPFDLKLQLDGRDLTSVTGFKVQVSADKLVTVTLEFLAEIDVDADVVAMLKAEENRSETVAPERPTTAARATTEPEAGPWA